MKKKFNLDPYVVESIVYSMLINDSLYDHSFDVIPDKWTNKDIVSLLEEMIEVIKDKSTHNYS